MALIDQLNQLTGYSTDMGGGPRPDDARALSQLIIQGGRASVGDTPIFGGGVPNNDTAKQLQLGPGRLFGAGNETLNIPVDQGPSPAAPGVSNLIPLSAGDRAAAIAQFEREKGYAVQPTDGRPVAAPAAKPPVSAGFQRVLNTANAVADSLTPSRASTVDQVLLPNPYGPGSYDPKDSAAVAEVKKQGEEMRKLAGVRDILTSGLLDKLPPGTPTGEIVKALFESSGLVKSDAQKVREQAQAKAEGERAGGKGKFAIPTEVTNAIGKPEFQDVLTAAVAQGAVTDPSLQLRLQQQHETSIKNARVADVDRRFMSGLRNSEAAVDDVISSYEKTPAFKSGKFTDTFKAALSTNNTATSMLEFNPLSTEGLSPEEVDFATKYNAVLGRLREFSGDSRFSDSDATRVMKALGNPITGPKVFGAQLRAIKQDLGRRQQFALEGMEDQGRDTSKFRSRGTAASSQKIPEGNVRVVDPNGRAGYIPKDQLSQALKEGYSQ